jgi:3-phosphoshikimate 1-carboxyvinyltransferase
LFPIATVLACNTPGETVFTGVERLAQKESNRGETIFCELAKLGYNIRIEGDKMYLCGKKGRKADAPVLGCSHNDHRIAMALYIASLVEEYPVLADEIKCIDKSFPSFIGRLKR